MDIHKHRKNAFLSIRPEILIILFLVVISLGVYWQVRSFDFVNFDDDRYILNNPPIRGGLSWNGIKWAFGFNQLDYWFPLTWLSHMLDCEFYGLNAGFHHTTNLILHIACSILLFPLLNRMTGRIWLSALVSSLFAIHPLNVESVAWVAERKNVLSTFLWLLTTWFYVHYVRHCSGPKWKYYGLTLLCYILGLLSKATLMTLPFTLLLLDWWPLKRFHKGTAAVPACNVPSSSLCRERFQFDKSILIEKIPFLIIAAISFGVTYYSIVYFRDTIPIEAAPFGHRLANATVSLFQYLLKLVFPWHLSVYYTYAFNIPFRQVLVASLILAAITAAALRSLHKRPYLAVGWFWFSGTLIPTLGILQSGVLPAMADRFVYISGIGFFIMVVWYLDDLAQTYLPAKGGHRSFFLSVLSLTVVAVYATIAWRQTANWQNSITLFRQAIRVEPRNELAHNNLGIALAENNLPDQAIHHYRKALQINPKAADTHTNLAIELFHQGNLQQAQDHLKRAIDLDPRYFAAHLTLAKIYFAQGDLDKATELFRLILQNHQYPSIANYYLGLIAEKKGDVEQAVAFYNASLHFSPTVGESFRRLGYLYHQTGDHNKAFLFLKKAVAINPNDNESQALLRERYSNFRPQSFQ